MRKPKTFRPWNPEQTLLLPPSPVEWLPANHLVFFLLDLATELDLSAIYAVYEARDPRGVKAYEPRMMVVLLLYAYCVGIPSSRRIERACWEDAAFPGLIQSVSQALLLLLSAWVEVGGIASLLCPKALLPQPILT